MLERAIRSGGNKKFVAPRFLDTTLSCDEIVEVVKALCTKMNERATAELDRRKKEGGRLERWAVKDANPDHYHVVVQGHEATVSWRLSLARLQQLGKKFTGDFWVASVKAHDQSAEGGTNAVEVTLLRWVRDGDGKIKCKDAYENLLDAIAQAVS